MENTKNSPDIIYTVPANLPVPFDDGACEHLTNMQIPGGSLWSTKGKAINLSLLSGWNVIFCYPMTGRPSVPIPEGWVHIPGAAGCTPQVCSYRDHHAELNRLGVGVYGISTQSSEAQIEASNRLRLPYPLLSDADHAFSSALKLPLLEVQGLKLIKRLTLVLNNGLVKKCFYPVFPPDQNVVEVIAWLSENRL